MTAARQHQAQQLIELARQTQEFYARDALVERAKELSGLAAEHDQLAGPRPRGEDTEVHD